MNTIRCFFLGTIVVIYSATFALGGEIQFPGKSDPTTTATPTVLTAVSTSYDQTQPTSTEEIHCMAGRLLHNVCGAPAHNLLIHSGLQLVALDALVWAL
jgi:hypothetical protein